MSLLVPSRGTSLQLGSMFSLQPSTREDAQMFSHSWGCFPLPCPCLWQCIFCLDKQVQRSFNENAFSCGEDFFRYILNKVFQRDLRALGQNVFGFGFLDFSSATKRIKQHLYIALGGQFWGLSCHPWLLFLTNLYPGLWDMVAIWLEPRRQKQMTVTEFCPLFCSDQHKLPPTIAARSVAICSLLGFMSFALSCPESKSALLL